VPESVIQPDWIPQQDLRRLHPVPIETASEIARLLTRIRDERLPLQRGTNKYAVLERAWIESLERGRMILSLADFDESPRDQIFLNVVVDGVRYFFACVQVERDKQRLELQLPDVVYRAERRDRRRHVAATARGARVRVQLGSGLAVAGRQIDASPDGIGIELERPIAVRSGQPVTIEFEGVGGRAREPGEIRSMRGPAGQGRWHRLGLVLTHAPRHAGLRVERRATIAPAERTSSTDAALSLDTRNSQRVSWRNEQGEEMRAIVDRVGTRVGDIAVIVPPAWGRTKESTLALSETILQTFERAGESVRVLRFDGIRKRGESHNEPDCVPPIGENRRYTFSQGVRDIRSAIDFLVQTPGSAPSSIFIVSFSIASVEARRAIAEDAGRRIRGWVSLVGVVDPQSMIRIVSGGVDYFAGAADGLRFGVQYIQGLLLDVDTATRDAIETKMAFLDDARRDMAKIAIPISWIAGTEDAWTSAERVIDMLSVGDASQRVMIEVPAGHQLRSSRDALETFEVAAVELARMALGRSVAAVQPGRSWLAARRREERRRLKLASVDLRGFWREYLVGLDGRLGIELVSATSAFRSLMDRQIDGLALRAGARIVDVGSGAGAFPVQLSQLDGTPPLRIVEVDLVIEGLQRTRERIRQTGWRTHTVSFVVANLDRGKGGGCLPLATASADAILASLVINYVSRPEALLDEAARVLRPGGRLVVSGMRPDADVSKLCVAGVEELRSGVARSVWFDDVLVRLDRPLQEFISSGARLLDLEEAEVFRFFDAEDLRRLVEGRDFRILSIEASYGDPAQAWVLIAERTRVAGD
jgi:ubiquinone/menaquinone biosynthesis C-methylase UbiE